MIKCRYICLIIWFLPNIFIHAQCDSSWYEKHFFPHDSLLLPNQTLASLEDFPIFPEFSDSLYQLLTGHFFKKCYAADSFKVYKPRVAFNRYINKSYIFFWGKSRIIFSLYVSHKYSLKERVMQLSWLDGDKCNTRELFIKYMEAVNRIYFLEIQDRVGKTFLNNGYPTYLLFNYVARYHLENILLHWESREYKGSIREYMTFGVK